IRRFKSHHPADGLILEVLILPKSEISNAVAKLGLATCAPGEVFSVWGRVKLLNTDKLVIRLSFLDYRHRNTSSESIGTVVHVAIESDIGVRRPIIGTHFYPKWMHATRTQSATHSHRRVAAVHH